MHTAPKAALFFVVLSSACTDARTDALDRARDLVFLGRYDEALLAYEAVAEDAASDHEPTAHIVRATALFRAAELLHRFVGKIDSALLVYRTAVETAPESQIALHARRARFEIFRDRLGDPRAALDELVALLDAMPNPEDTMDLRLEEATLCVSLARYDKALLALGRVDDAQDPALRLRASHLRASVLMAESRFSDALSVYQTLLSADDESGLAREARIGAASCLSALGRPEEAIAQLDQALLTSSGVLAHRIEARIAALRVQAASRNAAASAPSRNVAMQTPTNIRF